MPTPDEFYTASNRRLQDENNSRRLADAVARAIVDDELRPEQAGFIGNLDYFFLTTINEKGEPTVSYKGGPVGLAYVVTPARSFSRTTTATACSYRWATSRRR